MEDPDKEPVLLVPPRLSKSAYATLLSHDYVPRKWHVEGRYGSRTHKVEGSGGKIGLPLLRSPANIKFITALLRERDEKLSTSLTADMRVELDVQVEQENTIIDDGGKQLLDGCKCESSSLRELMFTPGVELIFETPAVSNRIPREEPFDATINRHRMRECFPSKLRDFITTMSAKKSDSDSSHSHNHEPPEKRKKPCSPPSFTFCELFAGIGGFGVALEALGGTCVFASEFFEPSKRVYSANLDTRQLPNEGKISGDIWEIQSSNIPKHDLLVGGFPCQPFSNLGNQPGLEDAKNVSGRKNGVKDDGVADGGGGRGQLFTQIVRVLKDVQPNAFLLENVPGLITTDHGNALKTIISALEGVNYHVTAEICSSRGLTAQSRKRLYIVGIRRNENENEGGETCQKPFQFPFIPDLHLRALDVLHTNEELQTSFSVTGVPEELIRASNFGANGNGEPQRTPASLFRLTDAQMDQLRNRSKSWKPAKLAWDNATCDTIDSHYGVTIGKVSLR